MMVSNELMIAATALLGTLIIALGMLRGWQGWLELKQRELETAGRFADKERGSPEGAARIELADLKERVRKLETIASGVDL